MSLIRGRGVVAIWPIDRSDHDTDGAVSGSSDIGQVAISS
jgi:hypothetical protein